MLHLPLWLRFVLSFGVAAALLIALVRFVDSNNSNSEGPVNPAAAAEQSREAAILVGEDQAPHVKRLNSGAAPAAALARAVGTDIAGLISKQQLAGPLGGSSCSETGRHTQTRLAFSCTVRAGGVSYPFLGVVDLSRRLVTYCKRDPPPVPSENIPVSSRCLPAARG